MLVRLTGPGATVVAPITRGCEADVEGLLGCLSGPEQETMAALHSRLLIAQAAAHGIDLFEGVVVTGR